MRELSDNEFNEIFNNHIQDLKQNGYDIIDPDGFDGYGHHYIEYKDNDGSTFVDVFFVDEENENVKIVGQEVFQNSVSEEVSNIVDAIDTGNLMFFDGDIETIPFSKNNSSGTLIE
jgi:hypothetical protein